MTKVTAYHMGYTGSY